MKEAHRNAFAKHVEGLNALLECVRRDYPNARYYLANSTLHLLSGDSHEPDGTRRDDRSLAQVALARSGGGDW